MSFVLRHGDDLSSAGRRGAGSGPIFDQHRGKKRSKSSVWPRCNGALFHPILAPSAIGCLVGKAR